MSKGTLNKVILIGFVGKVPEIKAVGETQLASFSVATMYKSKQSDATEWHNIKCFGKLSEIVGQYVGKGDKVYVEGRLHVGKYTDKNGQERLSVEIIAEQVLMLGSKKESKPAQQEVPVPSSWDADIPF